MPPRSKTPAKSKKQQQQQDLPIASASSQSVARNSVQREPSLSVGRAAAKKQNPLLKKILTPSAFLLVVAWFLPLIDGVSIMDLLLTHTDLSQLGSSLVSKSAGSRIAIYISVLTFFCAPMAIMIGDAKLCAFLVIAGDLILVLMAVNALGLTDALLSTQYLNVASWIYVVLGLILMKLV